MTSIDLEVADLADGLADWSPRDDLVLLIECVHDFPRPVEALRHAHAAARSRCGTATRYGTGRG